VESYNRWPDRFSLYDDGRRTRLEQRPRHRVELRSAVRQVPPIYENRSSVGSGEWLCFGVSAGLLAEQHGYDVTLLLQHRHDHADRALKCKCFISSGHDEYWDVAPITAPRR